MRNWNEPVIDPGEAAFVFQFESVADASPLTAIPDNVIAPFIAIGPLTGPVTSFRARVPVTLSRNWLSEIVIEPLNPSVILHQPKVAKSPLSVQFVTRYVPDHVP